MITLRELSKIANVSVSTMSKALSGADDISAETRDRLTALAQLHGYTKHRRRMALEAERAPTIAIIYSDITSNYYSKLLQGFDDRITDMNGIMLATSAQFKTERIVQLCGFFERSGVANGIICISPFNIFGDVPQPKLPMVGIAYPSFESHPFDYVCVNDDIGIDDAIRCFKELGHTRIGYMGEHYTWYRQQSFEKAMTKYGLSVNPAHVLLSDNRFEQAGYDSAKLLLSRGPLPTAVFAAYDDIALGAARVFLDAGLKIPDDISIAGIDNTMQALHDDQILASVNCHIEDQVEIALGLLMRKITDPGFTAIQNVNLRTEFVFRSTVGPPRKQM